MSPAKKYRVLLADDSSSCRKLLKLFISNREELDLVATAEDGEQALEFIKEDNFDLAILDIHMPEYSGIEIIENFHRDNIPYVIFATGKSEHALEAFDLGAIDYLLKPIEAGRFNKAIDRFLNTITGEKYLDTYTDKLSFYEQGKLYTIDHDSVVYISSNGKHSIIHCTDRDYETAMLLKDIHEKVPEEKFIRIHKKHLVNLKFIHCLEYDKSGYYNIFLNDEDETNLPIGRTYTLSVKEAISQNSN